VLTYSLGKNLLSGFAFMACGLLELQCYCRSFLPYCSLSESSQSQQPLLRWLFADGRQEIPGLSLALMALLLTLSANIGIGGMVTGFRETFLAWLDERLIAEIYYETATADDARKIEAWAQSDREIDAILPVWRAKTLIENQPVELMGMTFHDTYIRHFPLLSSKENVWEIFTRTTSILISEQLARRLNINIDDVLNLPTGDKDWRVTVAGIFPDYGNPKGQIRIDHDRLALHFTDASRTHYSLRVAARSTGSVMARMKAVHGEKIIRIVDQEEVKKISIGIFEKTFMITGALNTLMLIVSAVALFTSLLTLSNLRLQTSRPRLGNWRLPANIGGYRASKNPNICCRRGACSNSAGRLYYLGISNNHQCHCFWMAVADAYLSDALAYGLHHFTADSAFGKPSSRHSTRALKTYRFIKRVHRCALNILLPRHCY